MDLIDYYIGLMFNLREFEKKNKRKLRVLVAILQHATKNYFMKMVDDLIVESEGLLGILY